MTTKYAYVISKRLASRPYRIIDSITIMTNYENKILDNLCFIDNLSDLDSICKNRRFTQINLYNLIQDEFDLIINIVCDFVEEIEIINCNLELEKLEQCKLLKTVYCRNNYITNSLWNMKCNSLIKKLTIIDFPNLNNIEGIRNSSLESFYIAKDILTIPTILEISLIDFEIFGSLSNLKNLTLFVLENENKEKDLKELAKLSNLESLYLPREYFTFEQFAWLKSKLENTKNIDCIYYIAKDPETEKVVAMIIGKGEPNWLFDDGSDYKIYHNKYKELKEKFKDENIPPR